jgi:glycosyltransferase involved in cell wall biosynthesis
MLVDKRIAILMCTYNGARFLEEQLQSIIDLDHRNWELHISDDGSTDETKGILDRFKKKNRDREITIYEGPGIGFLENFLTLTCNVESRCKLFSWADQDDIWKPNKFERALVWFSSLPFDRPSLYGGRTELINQIGDHLGFSPLFKFKPAFKNALVQSLAGGNTMIFNSSLRDLLIAAGSNVKVASHDWWIYQLVTAVDGHVNYDATPTVLYRQHDKNVVGENASLRAKFKRLVNILNGTFKYWISRNLLALYSIEPKISENNRSVLEKFRKARSRRLFSRIIAFKEIRLWRQTRIGQVALWIAIISKKI